MEYRRRIVDELLKLQLEAAGAVLIEGAKWCGKTTTALQAAKSVVKLQDPEKGRYYRDLLKVDCRRFLEGEVPRLIDEWQMEPELWDYIRYEVDERQAEGQFILTGSAVPGDLGKIKHSGIGRFARILMRPMSLFESGDSTGEVSLKELIAGEVGIRGLNRLTLADLAYLICRGGWPQAVGKSSQVALLKAENYYEGLLASDMERADGVVRNKDYVRRFLRSFARNVGTPAKLSTLSGDLAGGEQNELARKTVESYMAVLKRIFVIEDADAWSPNLRSGTAIRTSPVRYFCDQSLGAAALHIGPGNLLQDLNLMGFLFENMCIRDLRIYVQALGGDVYHYRDRNGLECDAVLVLHNGDYALVEIKLGGADYVEEGARNLLKFASLINVEKMHAPKFKMVLVGVGEYAYRRSDGVFVVPVGCLRV